MDAERERRRPYSDEDGDEERDPGRHRGGSDRRKDHREGSARGGRDRETAKDKERDDPDRDRNRERRRNGSPERGHDRDRPRDKDHDRIKERDRERSVERGGKDRGTERGRDKDRDREREREKERERNREKERDRGKVKDREKQEKDTDRERHSRDKDKEHGRESDRDRTRARDAGREDEKDGWKKELDGPSRDVARNKLDGAEETVGVDGSQASVSEQPSTATKDLGERIMKMKEERLKRKNEGSEISSWVNKSRKIEEKLKEEKEKATRRMKVLEEQDNILGESDEEAPEHTAMDLAGLKILHGLDKVLEGGAVVLTLKDQNILANDDVNEEVDMLENVEIGEQKQRDKAYKAAKKQTGYDDKFSNDEALQKSILPQYDDPIEDEGVTLDESGRFTGEAEKKLEELRRRIQGGAVRSFEDLTSSGKISSDYYTSEEMLQFKKPKKKKSIRKKEKLDLDALEAEAKSAGLGVGDLGSRKDGRMQTVREEREKAEAESRIDAYKVAYAKAEEASKALRTEQFLTVKYEEEDAPVFGDDYEDLQKSLEQARKFALKKQEEASVSGPQAVALQALANNEKSQSSVEPQENKVVITEMEEFVLGLQFNEDAHKPESEDVFMDEDLAPEPMEIARKDEHGELSDVDETDRDAISTNYDKEEVALDETIHEVAVGKGLSGALKLLKERGALKETVEWGGRNMDKKKSKLVGIHENEGPKEIHIERTDEFGRILTPKEAFRVISHKFHGKGPGKMKQEKRMKQYQEELKLKQMKASDTPSLSVERMRETQARFKTPYLVLSGHVKPGQTSDPRSGFGTVEKDLGSLTPMLGDRKVEHFLGIRRKDDSSGVGLPPKIPKT